MSAHAECVGAMAASNRASVVSALCGEDQHLLRTRALLHGLDLRPGDRVLEVGCGSGEVLRELARLRRPGTTIVGVDSDPNVLEAAARNTAGLPGIVLERMDGRALRFATDTFDLVCCSRVLVHSANPGLLLSEMARVLKPERSLVAIEPLAAFSSRIDPDLRRRVHGQRHPSIGRDLPEMFLGLGLMLERFVTHTFIDESPRPTEALREELRAGQGLLALVAGAGRCSLAEVEQYLSARERSMAAGGFVEGVIHAGVVGAKPARTGGPS